MNGTVTVIVVEQKLEPNIFPGCPPSVLPKPFLAFVAANPQIRADGRTKEDALELLKTHILGYAGVSRGSDRSKQNVWLVDLNFDELVIQEVMDQ